MNTLIIEPGFSCLGLISVCKKLGGTVIVISADINDRKIHISHKKLIDRFIKVETNDINQIIKRIKKEKLSIDHVIPGSEYHTYISAEVSKTLKLPGNTPESALCYRNKLYMRKSLSKHKSFNTPLFIEIEQDSNIENILHNKSIKYPAVIKPTNLAGSICVKKINNKNELRIELENLLNNKTSEFGVGIQGLMLEEYIPGDEYSAEGYFHNKKPHIISITEKIMGHEPYFVELGHIVNPSLPADIKIKVENFTFNLLTSLGLTHGVFHIEFKINDGELFLIEINGRTPETGLLKAIKFANKIDLIEIMARSHMELPIKNTKTNTICSAVQFYTCDKKIFNGFKNKPNTLNTPYLLEFKEIVEAGYRPTQETFMSRVAYALFAGSYREVKSAIKQSFKNVELI